MVFRDADYNWIRGSNGQDTDKDVRVLLLSEVAGKLKYVDPKSEIIRQAKITGISFGDE